MSEVKQQREKFDNLASEYAERVLANKKDTLLELDALTNLINGDKDMLIESFNDLFITKATESYISGSLWSLLLVQKLKDYFKDDFSLLESYRKDFLTLKRDLWKDIFEQRFQDLKNKLSNVATQSNQSEAIENINDSDDSNPDHISENVGEGRGRLLTTLDTILEEDKKNPIPYLRWGRVDPSKWLDCSGLLYYTMDRAGFDISPFTSRTMFSQLSTSRIDYDKNGSIKKELWNIQKGDIIFWNSIDKKYKRSTWSIPTIKKDGVPYRIHHVAFVDAIDYDKWTIDIIESNGSQWVTKNTINVKDRSENKWRKKSELYVAHMDYNTLAVKNDSQKKSSIV
jgi:hypothetical protein